MAIVQCRTSHTHTHIVLLSISLLFEHHVLHERVRSWSSFDKRSCKFKKRRSSRLVYGYLIALCTNFSQIHFSAQAFTQHTCNVQAEVKVAVVWYAGDNLLSESITTRTGPNIPLILPIIQELYSPISTPLFKRKLPIILKKADKN